MFKKAINQFFNYSFLTRFLVVAVVCAIIFAGYMCIFSNFLEYLTPQDAVYVHFNELATKIIRKSSVDFLENSDFLNYYTITENSQSNEITINLFGYHSERLELVVSSNYTLLELNKPYEGLMRIIGNIIAFTIVFGLSGTCMSLIINVTIVVGKWLYNRWLKQLLSNILQNIDFNKIKFPKFSFKKKANDGKYATPKYDTNVEPQPQPESDDVPNVDDDTDLENII